MRKIEVNRRNFIKVMTGGSSIFLIPSVLGECSNGDSKIWLEGRKGPTAVTLSAPVETPTTDNQHSEVSICVARASTGREPEVVYCSHASDQTGVDSIRE